MKKFPIKFKLIVKIIFMAIALIIALLVFLNVKKMYDTGFDPDSLWLRIILLILAAVLLAFLINIAFFSRYKITNKYIYICLGILPIKIEISNIDKINKYNKNKETFIFYTKNGNHKTHMISIEYDKQKEFISELIYFNPYIIYTEDENPDTENKE